jgi:hypothetical protein
MRQILPLPAGVLATSAIAAYVPLLTNNIGHKCQNGEKSPGLHQRDRAQ